MEWLSKKEKREAGLFKAYIQGRLSVSEAQRQSGLPESTFWRRLKRYREGGALALAHRLRRRPSNRSLHRLRLHVCEMFRFSKATSVLAFFREEVKPLCQ